MTKIEQIVEPVLVNDKAVARMVSMSIPWVRQERYRRRKSKPHSFTVNPVYIGKSPRYRRSEVLIWINNIQN